MNSDGVERPLEIGIVEDDNGILAPQARMDALQSRRTLSHDVAPGHGFADETDGLDQRGAR